MTIHIDIGGEGRHSGAINLNPASVTSTTPARPIPNLVVGRAEALPFAAAVADQVTVESAPLRAGAAQEIARVVRPGGVIRLLHPVEYARSGAHDAVAAALGLSLVERSTTVAGDMATTILRRAAQLLR